MTPSDRPPSSRAPDTRSPARAPGGPARVRGGLLAACLAGALLACTPYVQGNGVYFEEERSVPAFRGVDVRDGIQAFVVIGKPGEAQSVVVSGDANVIPQLETVLRTEPSLGIEVLELNVTVEDFDSVHPIRATIRVPALDYVRSRDGSPVDVAGASATEFVVEAHGGSIVELSGPGGALLTATLDGGSRLDAGDYPVADAVLALGGGAGVEVAVSGAVSGTAETGCAVRDVNRSGSCEVVEPPPSGAPVSCEP